MKMNSGRVGIGRVGVALVSIVAVFGASLSIVAYQNHFANPSSSSISSSGVPGSETGSVTTPTSSGASGNQSSGFTTSVIGTSSAFVINPCNCTVDLSQNAWPQFSSLTALISASYTVVVATVTAVNTVGVNDSSIFGRNVGLIPVTDYSVTVSQVVSDRVGYGLKPGYRVIVPQVGGTFGHTTMNVTGYPVLAVGQSYVFFLTNQTPIPVVYSEGLTTVGAAQGLFYVQGGNVYSLDKMYPQADAWLPIKASGVPLAEFITQVQSAAAANSSAIQK